VGNSRLGADFTRRSRLVGGGERWWRADRPATCRVSYENGAIIMGMDVIGCKPTAPAGEYFRANIWSWRPIHKLIIELCGDMLDETLMVKLGYNMGAGPRDAATCLEMASRFDRWMESHVDGHGLDLGLRVTREGRFVTPDDVARNPAIETLSPYRVQDDHLKEWVQFLRCCGGFEVW
jgi:hypothetical protein